MIHFALRLCVGLKGTCLCTHTVYKTNVGKQATLK